MLAALCTVVRQRSCTPVAWALRAKAHVLVRMHAQHTPLLYLGLLTAFNCIKVCCCQQVYPTLNIVNSGCRKGSGKLIQNSFDKNHTFTQPRCITRTTRPTLQHEYCNGSLNVTLYWNKIELCNANSNKVVTFSGIYIVSPNSIPENITGDL